MSRLATFLAALTLLVFPAHARLAGDDVKTGAPVLAVGAVGMTVSDLDRAADFYERVLGFEKTDELEVAGDEWEHLTGVFGARTRVARLKLGDESIELSEYLAPRGRPLPPDLRSNDRSFQHIAIIVSDMDRAYRWLREHRVEHASTGPQLLPQWNPNAGGISAFYFRDPDGHHLEVLHFPDGKGKPKWHASKSDALFLGIDHTAIVVNDTAQSLAFYRDTLGMKIAGESENYGTEQEHLNNVFGARLRITSLAAPSGPGIELLEYLAPRDGRPYPSDARANDLVSWHTTLSVGDLDRACSGLIAGRHALVSPGIVSLPSGTLPFARGLNVRDPDGHVMTIISNQPRSNP